MIYFMSFLQLLNAEFIERLKCLKLGERLNLNSDALRVLKI